MGASDREKSSLAFLTQLVQLGFDVFKISKAGHGLHLMCIKDVMSGPLKDTLRYPFLKFLFESRSVNQRSVRFRVS